jgi:hypothetical protein
MDQLGTTTTASNQLIVATFHRVCGRLRRLHLSQHVARVVPCATQMNSDEEHISLGLHVLYLATGEMYVA